MSERIGPGSDTDAESEFTVRSGTVQQTRTDGIEPSYSVIETVSEAIGTVPKDLQPLRDVIDPDALNRIFTRGDDRSGSVFDGHLTFRYEGCEVTVHADGRTVVSPPDADQLPP